MFSGPDGFRYTDSGNARRFLTALASHVSYVPRWHTWMVYDGGRWRLDHGDTLVSHLAARIAVGLLDHTADVRHDEKKLKALLRNVRKAESAPGVAATLKLASTEPGVAIDHEALDADPWLLNVRNGTIDLRTGERRPHDPSDLLMMMAEADYEPDATAPTWDDFLAATLPDPDVRAFVRRLCGLALVGVQIEHVLVICLGGGANGKSTMTKVVADVLGDYAIVAARDVLLALKHDAHPTAKADLFRRRFAHSGELPPAAKLDEAQAKELTGGDRIKARRMREDFWEFNPSHLLWLHANHRPTIEGTDDGIWRRVLLIPFDVQVPRDERDPHLADKIVRNESAGVLRWMLDGLADYTNVGLAIPDKVTAATDAYRTNSNTVALFLSECDVVFDPNLTIDSNELVAIHGEWFASAGATGSEGAHWSRVVEYIKERGATAARTGSRGRFWRGFGAAVTGGDGVSG